MLQVARSAWILFTIEAHYTHHVRVELDTWQMLVPAHVLHVGRGRTGAAASMWQESDGTCSFISSVHAAAPLQ